MSLMRLVVGGLQGLLHSTRQDAELDRELRAFVEIGVEHKMRSGMGGRMRPAPSGWNWAATPP
jgi:hypothetical protein